MSKEEKTTKSNSNQPKRYRQFMFVQDLTHLKVKPTELKEICEKSGAEKWAFILHNKDSKDDSDGILDENGTVGTLSKEGEITSSSPSNNRSKPLVRQHFHIVLKFENAHSIASIAKLFKDENQFVEVWKGKIENAWSYLLHRTSGAQNKFQYSPQDVVSNFDFKKEIKKIEDKVKQSKTNINEAIQSYTDGEISEEELIEKIGVWEFAKRKKTLDAVKQVLEVRRQSAWLKEFEGKECKVIWIWGASGTGKTTGAKKIFENSNLPYTILGSSNDPFQPYSCIEDKGKNIILDDLRPNALSYADLIKVLDPYQHRKMGPARYRDRPLTLEKIVITTPYSPKEFYAETKGINPRIDTYKQLERRIAKVIKLPAKETK